MNPKMELPAIANSRPHAVALLRAYFADADASAVLKSPERFTGAHFERFAGGGDAVGVRNTYTAEDLVAVSMLGVDIDGHAALRILDGLAPALSAHLARIPHTLDLVHATPTDLGEGSGAYDLWSELKKVQGLGPTKVGKLISRKRPRLIPVYDSVVSRILKAPNGRYWSSIQGLLQSPMGEMGPSINDYLAEVRTDAGIGDDISTVRVLDVIVWMSGGAGRRQRGLARAGLKELTN